MNIICITSWHHRTNLATTTTNSKPPPSSATTTTASASRTTSVTATTSSAATTTSISASVHNDLKTFLLPSVVFRCSALEIFNLTALYKSTFIDLLTYLLTYRRDNLNKPQKKGIKIKHRRYSDNTVRPPIGVNPSIWHLATKK